MAKKTSTPPKRNANLLSRIRLVGISSSFIGVMPAFTLFKIKPRMDDHRFRNRHGDQCKDPNRRKAPLHIQSLYFDIAL